MSTSGTTIAMTLLVSAIVDLYVDVGEDVTCAGDIGVSRKSDGGRFGMKWKAF